MESSPQNKPPIGDDDDSSSEVIVLPLATDGEDADRSRRAEQPAIPVEIAVLPQKTDVHSFCRRRANATSVVPS